MRASGVVHGLHRWLPLFLVAAAACEPGGSSTGLPQTPTATVTLEVQGLPAGATAVVGLAGPNTYTKSIAGQADGTPASVTFEAVPSGLYTITATPATRAGDVFTPALPTAVQVTPRSKDRRTVTYTQTTGRLAVTVAGLPEGLAGRITISGPRVEARDIRGTDTLVSLPVGTYTVAAQPATAADSSRYAAGGGTITVTIAASPTPSAVVAAYQLASGSVTFAGAGIPDGVIVTGALVDAAGVRRAIRAGTTLRGVLPGRYTLEASPFAHAGLSYEATPAAQSVEVVASPVPLPLGASYLPVTGKLTITVAGLPASVTGAVLVTGPAGYSRTVTATTTLDSVPTGMYAITAGAVVAGVSTYMANASTVSLRVARDSTTATTLTYAEQRRDLIVRVDALPAEVSAAVTVTGGGEVHHVTRTDTLSLRVGDYAIASAATSLHGVEFAATPSTQSVTLGAGLTAPTTVVVRYAATSGLLTFAATGLPADSGFAALVTGPNGFSRSVTAKDTLRGLALGAYGVTPSEVVTTTDRYRPAPTTRSIDLTANAAIQAATFAYTGEPLPAGLSITIGGLPARAAAVQVAMPNGTVQTVTESAVLSNLAGGTYTITAPTVVHATGNYTAATHTQSVTVTPGSVQTVAIAYAPSLNLRVAKAYLTQSQQDSVGGLPIVQGRAAMARIFVVGDTSNLTRPAVRATFYRNGVVLGTQTVTASAPPPTAINEDVAAGSWHVPVPAEWVTPGLAMAVELDPEESVLERTREDNRWPAAGATTYVVREVQPFDLIFIPIRTLADGLIGNVTSANAQTLLAPTRAMFPLAEVTLRVREEYQTNVPPLVPNDSNGAWLMILNELRALRVAEGATGHYYGMVKTSYNGGIAGLGAVGGGVALGYDAHYAPYVIAHELGHNFNRPHAPCGGAGNPEASYPYAGGTLGRPGFDVAANRVIPATGRDLMGYCSDDWVSDYTYRQVLAWRGYTNTSAVVAAARMMPVGDARLLVWGRVTPRGPVLEPAFVVDAPAQLPSADGPATLEAVDANGQVRFTLRFTPERVEHTTGGAFAFAVPVSHGDLDAITMLRLTIDGRTVTQAMTSADAPDVRATRRGNRVALTWDRRATPVVLVRDPRTNRILSFARNGAASVATTASELVIESAPRPTRPRVRVHPER